KRLRHHTAHPAVRLFPLQPARRVIKPARVQLSLAAQYFTVQVVARQLTDDLPVQVYLLKMPAAAVQMLQRPFTKSRPAP
ncbi:hypothetical protein QB714_004492, partial [Salmonella enterica]|nr:hypothetical protein [Salmonella enterica]EKS4720708.1 hypothetical protein [Salmonella enterica]EKS4725132.1 hypothetical protein [Salmonella enterica]EKS4738818.1 hypothetical protein [Salmonella enterica]EKS4775958.1 hypothetical protein [Salmonella enterica]